MKQITKIFCESKEYAQNRLLTKGIHTMKVRYILIVEMDKCPKANVTW
jgi:hypothetical protein